MVGSSFGKKGFGVFFETTPELFAVVGKDGFFKQLNKAWETVLGYSINELQQHPFLNFIHSDDIKLAEKKFQKQFDNSGSGNFAFRFRNKKGDYSTLEWYALPSLEEGKIYAVAKNITHIRMVEKELSKTRARARIDEIHFKAITNSLPDLIWMKDPDGIYLSCNKAFEDFSGIKEKELIGKTDFDFFTKELAETYCENDSKVMKAREIQSFEEIIVSLKTDQKKYVETIKLPLYNVENNLIGIFGIARDITEHKAMEAAELSQRKFKAIADTSPLALYVSRGLSQTVIYLNPTFCNLFGYTQNEIKNIDDWWPRAYPDIEYRKQIGEEWNRRVAISIKNEIEIDPMETVVTCKDGSEKNILWGYVPAGDENWTFGTDLTQYRKAEKELIAAKEKAEESDRLKSAFLQNMSHEIRTPLNAIAGFSGFLGREDLSPEKRKNFISIIQNSSNQLVSIVTDILTISSLETKQEKVNFTATCVNHIIIDLFTIFKQQSLNQNISIYTKLQLDDKQSEILTDKTKLTQILTNLLSNALKFTHQGFIEFGYSLKGEFLEFYVRDSGIGVDSKYQAKIFERFRQANQAINTVYGGTGLGLAISKAFVELLGGQISVESEPNKGSVFFFTIPYKPVYEENIETLQKKSATKGKTILVAEDEAFNFLLIEEFLNGFDLNIIHTKDGMETIEVFKSNGNIDIILMDIKMPKLDGYQAAKIIKTLNPNVPIIAQSAYALEHERAMYESAFDAYVTKPLSEQSLIQKILEFVNILNG